MEIPDEDAATLCNSLIHSALSNHETLFQRYNILIFDEMKPH